MCKEIGKIVYQYTLKSGAFHIHEGIIIEDVCRKKVYFKDKGVKTRLPEEFGVLQSCGQTLWLTERNDEYAKRVFIENLERRISDLYKQIKTTKKQIEILKSEL